MRYIDVGKIFVVMLFCSGSSLLLGQAHLLDGLVAYYPLDGDAGDQSGNCLSGEVYGATAVVGVDGRDKSAMSFDGVDDYVEIAHDPLFDFDTDDEFTISFWAKIDQQQADIDTTDNDLISKWVISDGSMEHEKTGYPFAFRVINQKKNRSGILYAAQYGGKGWGCNGVVSLNHRVGGDTDFNFYALVIQRGKVFLYVNGEMTQRKGSNVFCSTKNKAPLRIGKRGGKLFQNHFKGVIDNLAIHSRALEAEEIRRLYELRGAMITLIHEPAKDHYVRSDTIFFKEDIFELTNAQKLSLGGYKSYLEAGNQYYLHLKGHTNGLPQEDFCDELSLRRARVVEDYLKKIGIECHQMKTEGLGKKEQIAPNDTVAQRRRNQRVEVILYQKVRA